MVKKVLWHFQKFDVKLGFIETISLYVLKLISNLLGRKNQLEVSRFVRANNISPAKIEHSTDFKSVGIVIVSSSKDFELLKHTIPASIDSLGNFFNNNFKIVVPGREIDDCLKIISKIDNSHIEVMAEEDCIDSKYRNKIGLKFETRYGWALQQFLKVSQVIQHKGSTQLVLDADTILLKKREWFDKEGRQVLFPSWEYNKPYYSLLNRFGLGLVVPKFTFVTHHMIMQEKIMREAMFKIGASSLNELIGLVLENVSEGKSSFCMEYELYAQYLLNFREESYFLDKWSNLNVPRNEVQNLTSNEIRHRYQRYYSISAHDYISGAL